MAKEFILQSDHPPRSLGLGGADMHRLNMVVEAVSAAATLSRAECHMKAHRHHRVVRRLRTKTVRQVGLVTMEGTHRAARIARETGAEICQGANITPQACAKVNFGFPHGPLWCAFVSATNFSISNQSDNVPANCGCVFLRHRQPSRADVS